MAKKVKFTDQELVFISAYIERPNATRAAIKAKYSEASAHTLGWRLLQRVDIADEIHARLKRITGKYDVSADWIISEMAKLARSNMADYTSITDDGEIVTDFTGVDRDQMAAIGEVTTEVYLEGRGENAQRVKKTKFKLSDKLGALMGLAKIMNIGHANRTELTGAAGAPVAIAHTIDIKQLPAEDREKLKSVLLSVKARGNGQVTDVEPVDEEDT